MTRAELLSSAWRVLVATFCWMPGLMQAGAVDPQPQAWTNPTPHEPFLRPHAAGTVSVFLLTPLCPTFGQVRELLERGDFTGHWQAVARTAGDGLELDGLGAVQQALTRRPPEVFIALGVNPQTAFHRGLWRTLFQQVTEHGLGAVLVARDPALLDQPELKARLAAARELPDPFPCLLPTPGPQIRRFELGRGRVAVIIANWDRYRDGGEALLGDWTRLTPVSSVHSVPSAFSVPPPPPPAAVAHLGWRGFEYGYARLDALLRWAANRDAPLTVAAMTATPAGVTLNLNWAGTATQDATVTLTARSSAWRAETTGRLAGRLQPGTNRLEVPWATPPPTGTLTAEARLTDPAGKVLVFAAAPFAAPVAPLPSLELAVLPSPILHHRDGELRIRLCVPVPAPATGSWQVRLTVRDRFGRLVLDETHATGPRGGDWNAPLDRWTPLTPWHEARAELRPATASPAAPATAVAETTFTLLPETPPWENGGGFQLGVYGAPERQALQLQSWLPALNRAGITWYTHAYSTDALYAFGGWSGAIDTFSFLPRRGLVRYAAPGAPQQVDDDHDIFTPALVPTAAAERATRDRWQERVRQAAARGAWFIGLDDERRMPADFDFSPDTLSAFRVWLERRYHGDLAALNQAWGGTTYSEFSQVQPWRRRELAGWPEADILAPWLEFRLFFSEAAGHWYSRLPAEWAATAAPGLPVGEFGIMPPVHDTMPWPLDWSRFAGCYRVSDYYRLEENWIGDCFRSFNPAMIRGAWMGYEWQAGEPYRRAEPWQALFSGARFAWLWEMRTAGWRRDAVLAANGELSPLYADLAAQEFPDLRGGLDRLILAAEPRDHDIAIGYSFPSQLLDPRAMGTNLRQVLHQLGYSYVLAPLAPDAPAAVRLDQARILMLPALVCLSAAERTRIQAFARRGGRVIALGPNGSRNNAGNRRPPDPAADGGLFADAAPRLGGPAAWTAPDGAARQAFQDALAAELAAAGLKPAAQLLDAKGTPVRTGFQAWGYALPAGRGHLVAVVYTGSVPVDGTLRFFRGGHRFELRQNRELGDGDTSIVRLETGDAKVYAILDYRVTALAATPDRQIYAPGGTVNVEFRLEADHGRPDLHALRLELRDPAGQPAPLPRPAMLIPGGRGELRLPLALDARPGAWRLTARDLASGLTATAVIQVK